MAALDWAVGEAKLRGGQLLALAAWNFPYVSDALGQAWDYEVFRSDAEDSPACCSDLCRPRRSTMRTAPCWYSSRAAPSNYRRGDPTEHVGYRGAMPGQLATIAIDAIEPKLVADFWCAVLGWQVVEVDTGIISIAPQDRTLPSIDVIAVPEGKTVKNRLHFDLRADGVSTAEELERLLDLGAQRTDVGQGPDVSWVVLADPEGNEFCLLSRSVQDVEQNETVQE